MRLSSASCTIPAIKGLLRRRTKEGTVQEQGNRYEIDIFWSDQDGCFIACVPDLDNCAAWGMTYEEALAQAHAAIRADLASRRRIGDGVPEATPRVLA
jgi:predicted RNase H-like HicB family nuclease